MLCCCIIKKTENYRHLCLIFVIRFFLFGSMYQFVCSMTTMNEKSFTFRKENAFCVCDVHLCWASWIRYRVINNHQSHSNQIAHFVLRHFTHTQPIIIAVIYLFQFTRLYLSNNKPHSFVSGAIYQHSQMQMLPMNILYISCFSCETLLLSK